MKFDEAEAGSGSRERTDVLFPSSGKPKIQLAAGRSTRRRVGGGPRPYYTPLPAPSPFCAPRDRCRGTWAGASYSLLV